MKRLLLAATFVFLTAFGLSLAVMHPAHTSAASSLLMSFQGKLTNTDGTNVTDGNYSIRFRIYTDPSADAASVCTPGTTTCKWEETQATVAVSAGIFQVNLGSTTTLPGSVDFNASALYLGVKVGSDAEMTPRVRLTNAAQAFNSDMLNGITSSGFVQLSPGSQQSGNINISGTIQSGAITSGAVNGITIGATIQPSAAGVLAIQSNGANALTLTGGAASVWSTTAGTLTVQGFAGTTIATPGASGATSAISILTGNSSAGTAGNVTIDTGTTSTGTPTVNIASANARAIQIGNNTSNPAITIDSGTGTIAIGTGAQARTVNIGTGAAQQTVTVGSASGASSLTLQAGTGNLALTTNGTGQLNIGANAVAQDINIGNTTGATSVAISCGTGACDVGNDAVAHTTTLGSASGTAATTLQAGTGGLNITTTGTGAVSIANNAVAQTVNIGNGTGTTTVSVLCGTGACGFGNNGIAHATTLGSVTGAASTTVQAGTGGLVLTSGANITLGVSDTTATLLVLDYKTTTGDPTAVNGGEYYNSANNKFRCAQNSVWMDCTSGFNTTTPLAADQAATQSSTTFQNVTGLSFPVAANGTYEFDAWIPMNASNTTARAKVNFTTPTGALIGAEVTAGTSACAITPASLSCSLTTISGTYTMVQVRGAVSVSTTAGTIQFQFAQNTATAASFPVVKKGAMITWRQQ